MWKTFKEHPVVAGVLSVFAIISAVVVFLAALSNIWGAFSHETVPDFLAKRGWAMTFPTWQAAVWAFVALTVLIPKSCELCSMRLIELPKSGT